MQAVFLNNKTCERVHPVRIRKDNPDAKPFYEGMDEPLREIHDIWIMQYLRVDGAYFPRIAFEANEDENIEFDSNQEYEILSRKTDGYIYFIPENFNIYTVGDAQFFYRKNGKKQKIRIHVASMLDGETYEKILKELTAISIRFLFMTMNDGKNRRIKREYLTEYELEIHQLEHTIKEMSETLKALDREPVTDMINRPARQNFRQVKHLDANVIMDHYVLKKPKVRTRVHEKTFHIYENQKVYNFVKLLEKRLWALEQELEDKKMQMNRAAQGENRSKYDDVEENSGVAGTKKSIDELCSTITNLKGKLQAVYQLPIVPGIMYRGGAEQKIRKHLVDNNYVDCIIQLPSNLFFGTSIATCIMVMKKNKTDNKTLFIDATSECVKVTNNNKLTPENIDRIVDVFAKREEVEHFAHLAMLLGILLCLTKCIQKWGGIISSFYRVKISCQILIINPVRSYWNDLICKSKRSGYI